MTHEILDSIFEPACIIDKSGILAYYNHYFSTFFKSSPRVLRKIETVADLFSGSSILEQIKATIESGSIKISKEEAITLPDETEYHVVIKTVPLGDKILICFNDISIEKNLYTKYRYQIEELKDIHAQIIQADKLQTIGEITASISHEVSNPLTIASGTIELIKALMDTEDINEQKEVLTTCIDDVHESFERINNIIKGMKKFLHGNEDSKEFVSLDSTLDNSIKLATPTLKKGKVELVFNKNVGAPIVCANALKLEQLFINLIKNSVDAISSTGSENGKISISTSSDDVSYIIDIIDNGPGIEGEIKGQIFDSFFTTKEVGEGTGLGLSISSKIIESYQGTLDLIESKSGAHFQVTIPKMEVISFSLSELEENKIEETKGTRALVIDNEPKILNLLDNLFKENGHHLICASKASEAMRILSDYEVDVIITDFFMPDMNGDEFIKKLRDEGNNTPVYYLTGKLDDKKLAEDKVKLQIKGVIKKPFSNEDILKILKKEGE